MKRYGKVLLQIHQCNRALQRKLSSDLLTSVSIETSCKLVFICSLLQDSLSSKPNRFNELVVSEMNDNLHNIFNLVCETLKLSSHSSFTQDNFNVSGTSFIFHIQSYDS